MCIMRCSLPLTHVSLLKTHHALGDFMSAQAPPMSRRWQARPTLQRTHRSRFHDLPIWKMPPHDTDVPLVQGIARSSWCYACAVTLASFDGRCATGLRTSFQRLHPPPNTGELKTTRRMLCKSVSDEQPQSIPVYDTHDARSNSMSKTQLRTLDAAEPCKIYVGRRDMRPFEPQTHDPTTILHIPPMVAPPRPLK